MNAPFFLALLSYPLTLSTHIGYPKIPPVKYPATSSEVVPQDDSSETIDFMPPDPINEEPLAATSEKPKRGSPDEFQCFLIRHLTTNEICHLRGPPRPPTNKDGVEPLDGVPVLPASRRFTQTVSCRVLSSSI